MASMKEFEEQHEAAKTSRSRWVAQPGTSQFEKQAEDLAGMAFAKVLEATLEYQGNVAKALISAHVDKLVAAVSMRIIHAILKIQKDQISKDELDTAVKSMEEEGEALVARAALLVSEHVTKHLCRRCGSPIISGRPCSCGR